MLRVMEEEDSLGLLIFYERRITFGFFFLKA